MFSNAISLFQVFSDIILILDDYIEIKLNYDDDNINYIESPYASLLNNELFINVMTSLYYTIDSYINDVNLDESMREYNNILIMYNHFIKNHSPISEYLYTNNEYNIESLNENNEMLIDFSNLSLFS